MLNQFLTFSRLKIFKRFDKALYILKTFSKIGSRIRIGGELRSLLLISMLHYIDGI